MNSSTAPSLARLTGSFVVALLWTVSSSSAQSLPNWQLRDICAKDSATGQCLLFEQRARDGVSASWGILPETVRNTCLTRITPPLEPSWRILGDCIEIEGRRALKLTLKKREDETQAELERRASQVEGARKRRLEAQMAAERKRVEEEEASFLARLAEQRRADEQAAAAKKNAAAARVAAEAVSGAEAERLRVAAEEASFLALLADQRRADAAARQRALADKQAAATQDAAKAKRLAADSARQEAQHRAEAEKAKQEAQRRAEAEKTEQEAQRRAEAEKAKQEAQRRAEAQKAKQEAQRRAEAEATRQAEAENRRVAAEQATFMAALAAQRRADVAAAKQKADAKKKAAAAARRAAANSCQARLKQVQSSGTIQFTLSSAALAGPNGTSLLDKLAAVAVKCEGALQIIIEGHTDSAGSVAGNNRLSQARAETVANYLLDKGVANDRVVATGLGSSKPIASNRTRAGRAQNRRIEFRVK